MIKKEMYEVVFFSNNGNTDYKIPTIAKDIKDAIEVSLKIAHSYDGNRWKEASVDEIVKIEYKGVIYDKK